MELISEQEIVLRLVVAAVLGGLVGFERERVNRPAGFRTHILVCVGSALVMLVSAYGFSGAVGNLGDGVDPSRIAAGVVTGIGFLGAGTILRQGNTVQGLTTAASLWVVSGVGLAVGIGFYLGGAAATVMVIVSLFALGGVESMMDRKLRRMKSLWIKAIDQPGLLGRIGVIFGEMCINITKVKLGSGEYLETYKSEVISMDFLIRVPANFKSDDLFRRIIGLQGVLELSLEGEDLRG